MKKTIIFQFIMLILLVAMVQAIESPEITVTLLNQDPDPVGPGQYVELRFKFSNDYIGTVAKDFQVMLDPVYPFSLDSNEQALKKFGDFPALGNGENVLVVKYKVRVDDSAIQGSNPIMLKYKHTGVDWVGVQIDVDVQTRDANLGIVSVETVPEKIKPGEKTKLKVSVKNMADSTMRDITMKLDLTYSTFLSQVSTITAIDSLAAFNALPFAPLGSATEQKIYSLSPGKLYEFTYDLIAYPDAESKVYKVPVLITYYDEVGTEYTKHDILGLVVGTKPDLSAIVDETDIYVGKRSGTVVLRFINKGFSDVKFLDVTMQGTDEFELLSAPEIYIGNVDSDDYETAEFKIYLKNGASKKESVITLPVHIEYRDANNNIYDENYDFQLSIVSPEKLGIQGNSGAGWFILVLIAVGVVFFYFRRKKKRK